MNKLLDALKLAAKSTDNSVAFAVVTEIDWDASSVDVANLVAYAICAMANEEFTPLDEEMAPHLRLIYAAGCAARAAQSNRELVDCASRLSAATVSILKAQVETET